jgi:hypothetical protein
MEDRGTDTEDVTREREILREHSKQLFGNLDRLEVAVAVATSGLEAVNATDLTAALPGWPNNRIRAQLVALAKADLLKILPRDGSGRVWYVRQPALLWDACLELYERWGGVR